MSNYDSEISTQYKELVKLERDLNNKIEVYNMYINNKKEPPKQLEYSIKGLQKSISITQSLIRTLEYYNNLNEKSKEHRKK